MVSEPVSATISLGTKVEDLDLLALGMNGRVVGRSTPKMGKDGLVIHIPGGRGTHWFVLKSRGGDKPKSAAASAKR